VPPPGEYVADGAAFQAMWALHPEHRPSPWPVHGARRFEDQPTPAVRARYAEVRDRSIRSARMDAR